jgi:hypothetical protein
MDACCCSKRAPAVSRRRFLEAAGLAGLAQAFATDHAPAHPAVKKRNALHWQAHSVAQIPSGYQVAVADVNGDGRPDILALSSEANLVEWYENPSWKPHSITTTTKHNISLAPLFKEGFPMRGLVNAPILGAGAEAPDYRVGALLTWYEPPEALLTGHAAAVAQKQSHWTAHLIDNSLTVIHGINVVDWDGDGRDEILTASFEGVHLFRSTGWGGGLRWTKTRLAEGDQVSKPRRGASEIATGKVHGRRFLATIEPWHGEQVAVYFEGKPGQLWKRQVIDDTFKDGHALAVADLDGDGNDEIVAGYRGQGTSVDVYYVADSAGTKWERQTLDTNMAAACVVIEDLNGDGRSDIVAIGASTGNIVWYQNLP